MPKIVRFHETGEAEVLQLEEMPLVEPGDGEVRLKVEALGLNRAEVMFRRGLYLEAPQLPRASVMRPPGWSTPWEAGCRMSISGIA
jgi:NADPH:quinone reductase-like Zn-dependent oxidoreductase